MSDHTGREMAGLAAVGLGVCCGLPLLLGAGALSAAAGIVLGSSVVAVIGLGLGVIGVVRWRRRRTCPSDQPADRRTAQLSGER